MTTQPLLPINLKVMSTNKPKLFVVQSLGRKAGAGQTPQRMAATAEGQIELGQIPGAAAGFKQALGHA